MKLTEERLVKMILEELDAMGEGHSGMDRSRDKERMKRRGTGTMTLDADHYAFVLPRRHSKWKSGIRVKDPYGWSKIPQDIKDELEGMAKDNAKLADAIAHAKELEQQKEG